MNSVVQKFACSKSDCTAATTGICLVGKSSPQGCEYYRPVDIEPTPIQESQQTETSDGRTFHAGFELGISDTLQVSSGSYSHVIGLMGPYNAGKTCFLLSLYLMASRRVLPNGYLFRRSLTLQGFEDRARRLRVWRGGPLPQQLADHTQLGDDRRPGFLHLGIAKNEARIDLILSDLPGEWTTSLINRAETASRWAFLNRADGIIIFLDGLELIGGDRFNHVTSVKQLLHRLKDTLRVPLDLPVVLLVSKADELEMKQPALLSEITRYAADLGFSAKLILCASFSRKTNLVPNGFGVVDALEHIIDRTSEASYIDWNSLKPELPDATSQTPFRMFRSSVGGVLL